MVTILRWLTVPLAGVAVWYTTLLLGFGAVSVLDSFCPPELVVSGMCTAPWHEPAVEALVLVFTALVAAGVVLVPAVMAPAHRYRVATIGYGCGAAFALYVASAGSMWRPVLVSAVSGSAALALAAWKWRAPASMPVAVKAR
jgi:hypothetical protein